MRLRRRGPEEYYYIRNIYNETIVSKYRENIAADEDSSGVSPFHTCGTGNSLYGDGGP